MKIYEHHKSIVYQLIIVSLLKCNTAETRLSYFLVKICSYNCIITNQKVMKNVREFHIA